MSHLSCEDPIAHLRKHKGKTLIQTVTDTDLFNKLFDNTAMERLERFKQMYSCCTVRHIGLTAYIYN